MGLQVKIENKIWKIDVSFFFSFFLNFVDFVGCSFACVLKLGDHQMGV